MSAGIDDGDAVCEVEGGVFGDGKESEDGFVFSGEDLDGGVLVGGLGEKFLGVGGDSEGHCSGGSYGIGFEFLGFFVGIFEGSEGFGGPLGLDEASSFCAGSESGDGGRFLDDDPAVVGFFGDDE